MSYCKRVCGTHDYRLVEPDKYVHIVPYFNIFDI